MATEGQEEPRTQEEQLRDCFTSFARGAAEMDQRTFAKVWKDCNLYDKTFTTTDSDLIFAKAHPKGTRKIHFTEFRGTIPEVARRKKMSEDALVKKLCECEGPVFVGTKAEDVKWHDDKATYTGVYAHGGPQAVDTKPLF